MKTRNLTGAVLDWAVAKCEGAESAAACYYDIDGTPVRLDEAEYAEWQPTTNWAQGGAIIEREKISTTVDDSGVWVAYNKYNYAEEERYMQTGATPLIAAMRCYVASQLGDEITLPQELTP